MNEVSQQKAAQADLAAVRAEFPVLQQQCHGKPLVYLDTGATAQKPQCVIEAVKHYYERDNANVHRGVYQLSERATADYEGARDLVQQFIGAQDSKEIIFTSGTTEAINLVANSFGALKIAAGDEIMVSAMEHHSNIVPWQMLCAHTGAILKVIPMFEDGTLDMEAYSKLFNEKTKLVAVIHVSNVLGTINPIKEMIALAHANQVAVLVDGAQALPRMSINVTDLDCDFYAFSSHKMYGPTGVGVLYAKQKWLQAMPPYQGGGDMISQVSFAETEYNDLPYKFEAGTPNIAGVVGLGEAIRFLQRVGIDAILQHELKLTRYLTQALQAIPGLTIYGHAKHKVGVVSFTLDAIHPHDIGTILDNEGIAVRAGHHCAMPLMTYYKVPAMARASLGVYNQASDVDALVSGLHQVIELFGGE